MSSAVSTEWVKLTKPSLRSREGGPAKRRPGESTLQAAFPDNNLFMNDIYHNIRPREIELIRDMVRKNPVKKPTAYETPALDEDSTFIIKPAGTWLQTASKTPSAKMLFDRFWFEGELCILFADTNAGKSILAVQIGDSISRGEPISGFELGAAPATVLYFDFELTDKQFQARYHQADYGEYQFNPQFLRAVFNPSSNRARKFDTFQQYIGNELENAIINTKAKVLIIDNITCLRYGTYAITGALNLIHNLQSLKSRYGLSILVLAHTPKRNPSKPITRNDLQGSKMLINFCDSAFAIGESQTVPGQRYIKQIKQRSTVETYGAEKVCLCNIVKHHSFLQFEFAGHDHEAAHLASYTEQHRKANEARITELNKQGLSIRQIAAKINVSTTTVFRVLKRLELMKV